jgi:rhodanese-related sulfurtransferase
MTIEQMAHYQSKLTFEMDSLDPHVAISDGEAVVVVDGRSEAAFAKEHIPGAINLPHRGICALSTEALDKAKTYICYCDGLGCNGSTKTALKLLTLGFKVRELIGGLDWWKRDGYQTAGIEGRAGTLLGCGC